MRVTRRSLIGMLTLGAAAAALAPAGAGAVADHAFEWDCAHREERVWRCGNCYRPDHEHAVIPNPTEVAYRAGVEQGRADGYNRGREVEAARQESRQSTSAMTWSNTFLSADEVVAVAPIRSYSLYTRGEV